MTPKEAELKYTKDIVANMWDRIKLMDSIIFDSPEGIDIPEDVWEQVFLDVTYTNNHTYS